MVTALTLLIRKQKKLREEFSACTLYKMLQIK